MRTGVPVVWTTPVGSASGYAEEARNAILALDRAGYPVHVDPLAWRGWEIGLSSAEAGRIERLIALDPPGPFVHVIHATPESFYRHPLALRRIGRTMFETDRIPFEWVARCNTLDELWVPSEFNVETFASAGVAREKLHRIPEALNRVIYEKPGPRLELPGVSGFVFLCVSTGTFRKGWDVLVRAYLEEFSANEDVTLVLAVPPAGPQLELERFVGSELGRDVAQGPRLVVLPLALSDVEMPRLYRAADAYVMPSRGEGWGRPFMEAMACGLPAIGTRWSGQLEFMNDENSYLVDCKIVDVDERAAHASPAYYGHRWAEPSLEHLRELMRQVATDRREGRRKGRRARREVLARYTWKQLADAIGERLAAAGVVAPTKPRVRPKTVVRWDDVGQHGFGIVARSLCRALLGTGRVDITESGGADVDVRHCWPPNFKRRGEGRFVVYQPWEWGSFPKAWIEPLNAADEVWVPTSYVRECAVRSGIVEDRVAVVPYGVDPLGFHPRAGRLDLPTARGFKFLFVGGTIKRKGFDILLRAYLEAFDAHDDVSLVVKDAGGDSFYRGQTLRDEIRRWQADVDAPELLYLDTELPRELMPSLYATCDCLVAPYRGEGFGLPIIEAMACGLPVVVPDHGACLDYCAPDVAYVVPAEEHRAPAPFVGELETVEGPWWAEIDRLALVETLRRVVERPEEAAAFGARASERVRRRFSWSRAADVALERLEQLRRPKRVARSRPRRRPRLSGCTIVRDAVRLDYPLEASILTYYPICDEAVVLYDSTSTDGTEELVAELARSYPRVLPVASEWSVRRESGAELGTQSDRAIAACTGDWVLYVQADEAIHEGDHHAIAKALRREDICAARFERRMFLGALEQEIPEYHARGLLRLFRAGTAWPVESAMTCALVSGEQRAVLDEGWRMFDYGRVGDPEAILRRKVALNEFFHETEEAVAGAMRGELTQSVSQFDFDDHPREVRARFPVGDLRAMQPLSITLAVLIGPGERQHARRFARPLRGWPGDVVLIDDSRGDGGCAALRDELAHSIGDATKIQVETWPASKHFGRARDRAHELARGDWVLHADVDELWDARVLRALPELVDRLEREDLNVCVFSRANSLDGVLVNDIPSAEWSEEGLRRAALRKERWPPVARDDQPRLVRRSERWGGALHESPRALTREGGGVVKWEDAWIYHSKTLVRQRLRDEAYRVVLDSRQDGDLRERVLVEAVSRVPTGPTIAVETGTLRNTGIEGNVGDGWSTLRLARLLAERGAAGSRLYSIDTSEDAIRTSRSVVPRELHAWVEWIHADSREALAELPVERIDLLYLDSSDDPRLAQEEFAAATRLLGPQSIVVLDDTGPSPVGPMGKGSLVIPATAAAGWQVEHRAGERGRMTILTPPR